MKTLTAEIENLVAEIPRQCGLSASTTRMFFEDRHETLQVQIRLVPCDVTPYEGDWLFLNASQDHHYPGLRDQLTQFILEHRKPEAA